MVPEVTVERPARLESTSIEEKPAVRISVHACGEFQHYPHQYIMTSTGKQEPVAAENEDKMVRPVMGGRWASC